MRVAVLGLGSIGSRHARNLTQLGHEVVSFDPDPAREGDWTAAPTAEDAVAMSEAVLVATPSALHAEHAIGALEQRRPVLVEKPLAVTPADAERVAELSRETGVPCAVAMNLRFHPGVLGLRALIEDGTLGPVRYAQVSCGSDLRTWRPGSDYRRSYSARSELGGGAVHDCIHELDYLTWLLGPAVSVTAETGHVSDLEIDVEDLGLALVRLASGALASVDLTYIDPVYRRGCLLVGARATARWGWSDGVIEIQAADSPPQRLDVTADVSDTYIAELRDFFDAVAGGHAPRATAEEGARAVRLADGVLEAARTGRRLTL